MNRHEQAMRHLNELQSPAMDGHIHDWFAAYITDLEAVAEATKRLPSREAYQDVLATLARLESEQTP